jgi:hypothetical protein
MELIAERGRERYEMMAVPRADDFAPPHAAGAYACLLWDARGHASDGERARLARTLVASGCAYAVCGGAECEAWHDAIDEALIGPQAESAESADAEMTTTWHEGESPAEVAAFFVHAAIPPGGAPSHHLLLLIGDDANLRDELIKAVRESVASR